MISRNLVQSANAFIKSSQQQVYIEYSQRFYAKKMVSKRVYELLKREKIDWESIKTPEEFKALCMPLDNRPLDSIKPELAKHIKSVEQYLAPNLSSSQRTVQEELKKNIEVGSDLQQLINKIKYQDSFGDMDDQATAADIQKSQSKQSVKPNAILKKQKIKTARQVIEEMNSIPIEEKEESIVQQYFASGYNLLNDPKFKRDIVGNVEHDEEDFKLNDIDERKDDDESNQNDYDPEDPEAVYLTLADQLQQKRLEENLARTSSPVSKHTVRHLKQKQSKSRFYYKAGKGSPLYELSKHQLEEINKLEKRSVELLNERNSYVSN
ncbi:hypothetical protein DLAC_11565 [Tieghemostelium lacteum]|uniref:Uncharacterized protein n=1 Tax=Tieghemostelium lacteum TaxID=361077 RepID=A0A152A0X5_TIELA|nr:hypothetical protein DLAC_11565 [Tieghemostelium lacteum]|eukprot:KYQ99897.1 hypothetical protein DLAC_11565 [Tieghemostelium lacteum]